MALIGVAEIAHIRLTLTATARSTAEFNGRAVLRLLRQTASPSSSPSTWKDRPPDDCHYCITRYQTRVEATERNAELLDAVFTELAEIDADGFTLKVFRFADDNTFVHVLITHDDVDRPTDLDEVRSWRAFLAGFSERVEGAVETHNALILGGWR